MIIDCPHCYKKIVPSSKGICPACQNNTKTFSSENPELAVVQFENEKILPNYCIHCGCEALETDAIARYGTDPEIKEYAKREMALR